jgi:hypothetical protein
MKKLMIAAASLSLAIAAPAVACPDHDEATPRTAEKAKDTQGKETAKAADKAKAAKPAPKTADKAKTPDKVSQK